MDFEDHRVFTGQHGLPLHCRYWKPNRIKWTTPRGCVFLSHGLFEYCGCEYSPLIEKIVDAGFLVFGHDHAGHGKSGGTRGNVQSLDAYADDLILHAEQVHQTLLEVPLFIIGHSMGGAVAILVGLKNRDLFRGIVLIGPAIIADEKLATPTKRFIAKCLSKITPSFPIAELNNDDLCLDKEMVNRFNSDPLVIRQKINIGTTYTILSATEKIVANMEKITFPFLVIHGGGDKMCDPKGASLLLEKASSSDKTFSLYPGALHRVHNEPNGVGSKCVAEIVKWLIDRS